MHLTPVAYACQVFGSARRLARLLGTERTNLQRWQRPKSPKGGCDGEIPNPRLQRQILILAKAEGLPITAEDLILGHDLPDPPAGHMAF